MKFKAIVGAAALSLAATGALAATVYETVWLTGNAGLQATGVGVSYTSGLGVTIDATAHHLNDNGSIGIPYQIGQWGSGLGVISPHDNTHQIDGYGPNEVVKLSFSRVVTIERAWFSYVGHNDDFSFTVVDGVNSGTYYASTDIPDDRSYEFKNDWTGTMFGFGASGWNDDYKLKKIKFSYDPTPPNNPPLVPLPASGWLLLAAFGAAAAMRKRKSA